MMMKPTLNMNYDWRDNIIVMIMSYKLAVPLKNTGAIIRTS